MKPGRFLQLALLIGGVLTAVIGVGHIFMPTLGYDASIPSAMAPAVRDHFYYLGTYAICAFLLSFAFLSLYASRTATSRFARVVCSTLALFWVVRAILEVRYPVDVRIFFLKTPHTVLLPVICFLAALYSLAALEAWWRRDAGH